MKKRVTHTPNWVAAPLRYNEFGDTKPGFLCIYELENGNGWCGSNVFNLEDAIGDHACIVRTRDRWKFSRGCYDKYHRCPGWAGGGWKHAEYKLCDGGYLRINYEDRWRRWKIQRCCNCDVVVLPYMFRYTSPKAVWYEIKQKADDLKWWFMRRTGRW